MLGDTARLDSFVRRERPVAENLFSNGALANAIQPSSMILHPILAREMKKAASNPVLYWLRMGIVLLGVAAGIFFLRGTHFWYFAATPGREIFQVLVWAAFVACLLSGVLLTASLLCEERREGSLALLFLTKVTGFDIVASKLLAVALLACQIVLGLFPVMALCITLGGVSLAEFWRAVQLLLTTLFFSLSAGIFISALNKQISRAVSVTFTVVIASTALIAWIDWRARESIGLPGIGGIVPGLIPALTSLSDLDYALPPQGFNLSVQFMAVLSTALLVLGGLMLKRLAISEDTPRPRWTSPKSKPRGHRERRAGLRRNPIQWLAQRHRWRWLATWIVFCLLMVLWTVALHIFDFSEQARLIAVFGMAPVLHLLLKAAIAAEAVERLGGARSGELELLLVTPLRDGNIPRGHHKALLRQFTLPIGTMVVIDLIFVFGHEPAAGRLSQDSITGYLFVYALALSLIIDLPALVSRGLWNGLRCDSAVQAVRRTLLDVVILPVPLFLLSFAAIAWVARLFEEIVFAGTGRDFGSEAWLTGVIVWWGIAGFVCNAFLQRNAQFNLSAWLRFIAADPLGARVKLRRMRPFISAM
jgi:hypothetical protein